jgi:hypothetical protein
VLCSVVDKGLQLPQSFTVLLAVWLVVYAMLLQQQFTDMLGCVLFQAVELRKQRHVSCCLCAACMQRVRCCSLQAVAAGVGVQLTVSMSLSVQLLIE